MKTILVTGANRGIGLEVCKQLDALGHQVLLCSRNRDKGINAAKDLSSNVIVQTLDITNIDSITNLFEFVKNKIGKLDCLINNAAIGVSAQESDITGSAKKFIKENLAVLFKLAMKVKPIISGANIYNKNIGPTTVQLTKVKDAMDTNLFGHWQMVQSFIPLLKKSKNASIINISSAIGAIGNLSELYPAYSISKSSLNALTIMLAKELDLQNIRVNAVCPGWVKTDMGGSDAPKTVTEGADTIVWLATNDENGTGQFYQDRKIIEW